MRLSVAALFVAAIASPALAQDATPVAPPATSTEKAEVSADAPKVKIICVRHEADTGSHMGATKECHTEAERAMIRDRVLAGLDRARSSGKRLGRPRTTPFQVQRIRAALGEGRGVRETARLLKVSAAKVSEVRRLSATAASGAD